MNYVNYPSNFVFMIPYGTKLPRTKVPQELKDLRKAMENCIVKELSDDKVTVYRFEGVYE